MERGPARRLVITAALAREVETALRCALPEEGCGLVAGTRERGGVAVARRFVAGTNMDSSPLRYTMDPGQVARAFDEFERDGQVLLAIAHSHPDGPATPSATDLREFHYPDALMLVADLSRAQARMRAWSVDPVLRRAAEATVVILPATAGPGEGL